MTDPFLEPYLDDSHRTFADACRRFAATEIAPHAEAWEEAGSFPRELYEKAADAGVLAPTWPAELGGGGGDVFHGVVAGLELQRGGSTGVVVGLGSLAIALPPIVALGTPEQHQRFVPEVLAGRKVAALAITEPGTGSDVARVRTRAVRDGASWRLTGSKTFITSGVRADLVTVLARTSDDPHGGLTFFVVERGTPGFEVSRALRKTGWWASDTAELSFDGAVVPDENRLGPEGTGFPALMRNFEGERLMLAVNGVALASLSLEHALAYAKQREAFGRPLTGFQVTRHKLAEMATRVAGARALTYAVADRMRRGIPSPAEVAMAKNLASDVARDVTWEAVQIFGGMGYMRETVVERFARDARLLPIGGGTQEIMREIVARMGLGL
ncbi:MAG: acyl-CoA dehydrogenase family protein [Alphaproteobacteria bacterium]|nr:acyl-CoA dehydrogenase family protein [Alphaproteobacteria bacterium]